MPIRRLVVALDYARRYLHLQWWEFRRRYYCPVGRHLWSYFGKVRVCRACHHEEQRYNGEWREAASGWAPAIKGHEDPTNGR